MSVQSYNKDEYLRGRHSVSKLVVHLVFTTKYRRRVLTGAMIDALRASMVSACKALGCEILEMDGEVDHIHVLVTYPPKMPVSVLVNNLKSISSRQVRLAFPDMKSLSKNGTLWSRSYFACSAGGATIETLKGYVESQNTPK